jgi:hypothetical protein
MLTEQLASRVRAILRSAAHPASASGTAAEWKAQRDHWIDALDPRGPSDLGERDVRGLIDFLAESGPSGSSRMTIAEWGRAVDALTPELLFTTR